MDLAHLLPRIIGVTMLVTSSGAFLSPRLVTHGGNHIYGSRIYNLDKGLQAQPSSLSSPGRAGTHAICFHSRNDGDFNLDSSGGGSRIQKQRPSIRALQAASGAGSGLKEGLQDRTSLRRTVVLGMWVGLLTYIAATWFSLPGVPALSTAVQGSVDALRHWVGGESPLSYALFCNVGVVSLYFGPLLISGGAFRRGKQLVPPMPFVVGAWFCGFSMIGPYIALRNYLPEGHGEEAGILEKLLTNKVTSVALLGLALYYSYAMGTGIADTVSRQSFIEDFRTVWLVHFCVVDFTLLCSVIVDPIREDMRRRGLDPSPARVAPFLIPILGPALWLVVRPPVTANANVDGTA